MLVFRGIVALLCLLSLGRQQSHGSPDYLLVERVDRLVIQNKYQQDVTGKEQQLLTPFIPIRILKADDLLGDGFTRCMKVEIGGEVFYLLKDESGKLARSGALGFERTYSNTSELLDTVQVNVSSLRFSPPGSSPRAIQAAQKLVRIFRHGAQTFCEIPGNPTQYGWVDFSGTKEGKEWKLERSIIKVLQSIPSDIIQKIQTRLDETNRVLSRLFGHFNRETGLQKTPPQWTSEILPKSMSCTLTGTTSVEAYDLSTRYLLKDVENLVLGSGLEVVSTSGKLVVRVR